MLLSIALALASATTSFDVSGVHVILRRSAEVQAEGQQDGPLEGAARRESGREVQRHDGRQTAAADSTRKTNCGLARIASSAAAMPLSKSRSRRPAS